MVAIEGLGGIPEPKPERPSKVRGDRDAGSKDVSRSALNAPAKDDLTISSEAKAAAELTRLIQVSNSQSDLRADKVAAAKERIERGDYRNPEVVAKVAERILKFLG